jgi:hypothetical protein
MVVIFDRRRGCITQSWKSKTKGSGWLTYGVFQLYYGSQFYRWRKPPTCRKLLTNLSHNVVSSNRNEIKSK